MKERLRALAPYVGFPIFYLFSLFVFLVWTFPFETIRDRLVASFNKMERDTNGQMELKIDELGPSWLNGVSFKGARLVSPSPDVGKPPVELKIDEGSLHVSLFGLMVGDYDVSLHADAFGGSVKAEWDESSKERKLEIALEGVDLSQIPQIAQAATVPVEGTLGGSIKLTVPDLKVAKANGSVSLETTNLSIGDGKAKLKGFIALPKITLGTLTIDGDAKEGVLKLSKLGAGGRDLELQGDGRVQLREQLLDSFCDLNLRLKINDAYRGKSDTTKALFGEPGSSGPSTLELTVPQVKQSKRADGFYGWHMHGLLSKPEFDPAPMSPATPGMTPGMKGGPG